MHIRPLSPFGAEVIGIDLDDENALDGATCDALRRAWVENGILLFRNALHSEEAHLRLSRVFGDPQPSAVKRINDVRNAYFMTLHQQPGDASLAEKFGIIDNGKLDSPVYFRRVNGEIELRARRGIRELNDLTARQCENTLGDIRPIEQNLKQGVAAEIALGIQFLHDFFER